MLFELILLSACGLLFIALGLIIWRKRRIDLISSLHSSKVSEENKPAFTALFGKALILMGIGMIMTGVFDYGTRSFWGWIYFALTFIIGLGIMIYAQAKYNRDQE